jgi:hypothetical protein
MKIPTHVVDVVKKVKEFFNKIPRPSFKKPLSDEQKVLWRKWKFKIYGFLGLTVFLIFWNIGKPKSAPKDSFLSGVDWIIIGGVLGILAVAALATRGVWYLYKNQKTTTATTQPSAPTPVVTQTVSTPQAVTAQSDVLSWLVVLLLLVGMGGFLFYYFPKMYPNEQGYEVLKKVFTISTIDLKFLAPYLIAPLVGLVSYYWSKWGARSFGASLVMVLVTCFLITFWIHPGFMTAVLEPYVGPASMHQFVGPSNLKLFMVVTAVSLVAVIMGYIFHVACFLAIMFMFFFYLSY